MFVEDVHHVGGVHICFIIRYENNNINFIFGVLLISVHHALPVSSLRRHGRRLVASPLVGDYY
jgi:hypothetical protein